MQQTAAVESLMLEALQVVNRSLAENRGEGLYGKALEVFDDFMDGHVTDVHVYEDHADNTLESFTLEYRDGRFLIVDGDEFEEDSEWNVSVTYLTSLADDPETYIEHPTRMDWDWLADRLPDTALHLIR